MCVKNAYVLGDVRRRKCREASKVTVLVAAGSAEQCCIVVLLFALARNVLRVFGSLYKATSVILWCYSLHLRETCLCIVAQLSALA